MKRNWIQEENVKHVRLDDTSESFQPDVLTSLATAIDIYPVLEVLRDKKDHSNQIIFELRMSFFVAATTYLDRKTCLQPFPTCFMDRVTNTKHFSELIIHINNIPAFVTINESTQLPFLTWELLNWILTNPLTLEPLIADIPANAMEFYPNKNKILRAQIEKLKTATGLFMDVPILIDTDVFILDVTPPEPKTTFVEAKKKYGSGFAFHGSFVRNFYSILNRGFLCALNVRSSGGHGTYMTSDFNTSVAYALRGQGWTHDSSFENQIRCIGVLEIVMSPQTGLLNSDPSYVCDNDDHMQLSHLIVIRY